MAPSVLPVTETSAHDPVKPAEVAPTDPPADKRYFPDGLKTSGQHPALEDAIFSYEDFPKQISGPTVWTKSDYQNHPDRWTHPFTQEEISELSEASDQFIESGAPLTGLTRVSSSHAASLTSRHSSTSPPLAPFSTNSALSSSTDEVLSCSKDFRLTNGPT